MNHGLISQKQQALIDQYLEYAHRRLYEAKARGHSWVDMGPIEFHKDLWPKITEQAETIGVAMHVIKREFCTIAIFAELPFRDDQPNV